MNAQKVPIRFEVTEFGEAIRALNTSSFHAAMGVETRSEQTEEWKIAFWESPALRRMLEAQSGPQTGDDDLGPQFRFPKGHVVDIPHYAVPLGHTVGGGTGVVTGRGRRRADEVWKLSLPSLISPSSWARKPCVSSVWLCGVWAGGK